MIENADALVLNRIEFSETSLIVSLFTRQFGKIDGLAKGGRRLKSSFESALDTLAHISVTFLQKKSDSLDLLTESKLIRRFSVTENNLAGLYAGYYVAELVQRLTEKSDPLPKLFDVTVSTLRQLEQGQFVMRTITRFESQLLRHIGEQPSFLQCVSCGKSLVAEYDDEKNHRIGFSHQEGGVLCRECRENVKPLIFVTKETMKCLSIFADPNEDDEHWKTMPMTKNIKGEIRSLQQNYLCHRIGYRPKLFDWLGFIAKNDVESQ